MAFIELKHRTTQHSNPKLQDKLSSLQQLLQELQERELPDATIDYINHQLRDLNAKSTADSKLYKAVFATQHTILKYLEKYHKIVSKGHYQKIWMVLGMSLFGVPMGVAFGTSMGNMAFLGTGIPLGMVIGMAVGSGMDKKAAAEGRQLDY
ncbi:hypothetical protein [Winogradskyella poriferorum]|uniref:hypothetical protein n=1 Tax=Winogradskyella poriferorum TaxID=307627 RepID=UPI003D64D608